MPQDLNDFPAPVPGPFELIAPDYNRMGFLMLIGQHLAAAASLQPGEQVLDVATGTGHVAFAAARLVGETGAVTGLDLSPAMLAQARIRMRAPDSRVTNLSFILGDGMHLPFGDERFSTVLCSAGLFFMSDLVDALREWRRVLRPGGRVGFTAFNPGMMAPLPALWAAQLAPYHLTAPGPPTGRLPSAERAWIILEEAGFSVERVSAETLPYRLERPEDRWSDIEAGLEGLPLRQLPEASRASLRAAHLAELETLFSAGPLTVDLPLTVAFGRR